MELLAQQTDIHWPTVAMQVLGGLALFLFGMQWMTEALTSVAGRAMKGLLQRLTANRFLGMLAGTIITAVIQSSSVTTVLVIGFISAGLMTLSQSIGVIIGANIGTTVTAQIIAFKIYHYGLVMIAVGFLIDWLAPRESWRNYGAAILGLGLVFYGMQLMTDATAPLKEWPAVREWLMQAEHPLKAILVGALVTAIVQSSSATTGMVIILASQQLISLELGIGLILGANIGTCVTALLASMRRSREAKMAAWAHVLFNVGGVLIWVWFIPQLAQFLRQWPPMTDATESARVARQIANAHTIFNVGNAFIFIWFTGAIARVVDWIVPRRGIDVSMRPMYLDKLYLDHPTMALEQVRRELVRLGQHVESMLQIALRTVVHGTRGEVLKLRRMDDFVDTLDASIIEYLGELSKRTLNERESQQHYAAILISNNLESIGDVIETNLVDAGLKRLELNVAISNTTLELLQPLHDQVNDAFRSVLRALDTEDRDSAQHALESKQSVFELADRINLHLTRRLVADEPNRLATFQVETEIIEHYKRLNTLTRRMARATLEFLDGKSNDSAAEQPTPDASQPTA